MRSPSMRTTVTTGARSYQFTKRAIVHFAADPSEVHIGDASARGQDPFLTV